MYGVVSSQVAALAGGAEQKKDAFYPSPDFYVYKDVNVFYMRSQCSFSSPKRLYATLYYHIFKCIVRALNVLFWSGGRSRGGARADEGRLLPMLRLLRLQGVCFQGRRCDPKLETRNPKPKTRNPKPETRNLKLGAQIQKILKTDP